MKKINVPLAIALLASCLPLGCKRPPQSTPPRPSLPLPVSFCEGPRGVARSSAELLLSQGNDELPADQPGLVPTRRGVGDGWAQSSLLAAFEDESLPCQM